MVGPRLRNLWVIWVSFALALLLSVAPMPAFMETGRPLWLALCGVVRMALTGMVGLLIIYVVMSWVQARSPIADVIQRLAEPMNGRERCIRSKSSDTASRWKRK